MDWLQILVVPFMGIILWWLKSQAEALRAVEERLDDRRQEIFTKLLEPYILLVASIKDPKSKRAAINAVASVDYRRTAFHLMLIADDDTVRAYNGFMRFIYEQEHKQSDPREIWQRFGQLLLAVRKGLGNKNTELDERDMLQFMMKDLDYFMNKAG